MTRLRPRSAFSPSLENLPSRIAPTVFAPPPMIKCEQPMPTVEITSTASTTVYPNNAQDMLLISYTN